MPLLYTAPEPQKTPVTLEEHEAQYAKDGHPLGWCRTCDKKLWATYGATRSIVYSIPIDCEKHDWFVKSERF